MSAPVVETGQQPAVQQNQPTQQQGDPAELGDPGKKALTDERNARKAAERQATDLQRQLDALNQASESALEKAQREAREATENASRATAEALRWRIAAKHGISDDDAETFLTGSDEAALTKQAERLAALNTTGAAAAATIPGPRPDLSQGGKSAAGTTSPEQDFAVFLQNQMT